VGESTARTSRDPLKRLIVHGQRTASLASFIAPVLVPGVFLVTWTAILLRA
jgi:hypothetical protein